MSRRVSLRSRRARIIAAALGAVVVAELAVWALSPEQPGPAAVAVDALDYLDAGRLQQALEFRAETRVLGLLGIALELAALGLVTLGRPRFARRLLRRFEARPLLGAAAAGGLLSLSLAVLALPLGIWAQQLAVDVGLSVQSLGGWLFDRARSAGIAALYAAVGALLLILLQRRLPRAWWLAASGVVVSFAAIVTFLTPVVLAPIFNDFERLPDGPERSQVLSLADRAGVEIGDVYRVDASSRRTSLNAYVSGIGSTRRVVLYDNLLDATEGPALRSVVAHELGHVKANDIGRGLLFVALITPVGMLFVREAGAALAARSGAGPGQVAALPAYALALTIATLVLGIAGNQLSRAVEERADRFALELTDDPAGLIDLQQQLAERNLRDPEPPRWSRLLFATHPSTVERIGVAEGYREAP
ncbi:MAG: M48 family peptidase [Solirubrobacterales bacterium]|nr:MAG: M48 family peptidase [Solirubrobacterales bacterium]